MYTAQVAPDAETVLALRVAPLELNFGPTSLIWTMMTVASPLLGYSQHCTALRISTTTRTRWQANVSRHVCVNRRAPDNFSTSRQAGRRTSIVGVRLHHAAGVKLLESHMVVKSSIQMFVFGESHRNESKARYR